LRTKAFQKSPQLIVRGSPIALPLTRTGADKPNRNVMTACRGHQRVLTSELVPSPRRDLAAADFAADRRLQVAQNARGPPQHLPPRLIRAEPPGVHLHRPRLGKQQFV